MAGAYQIYDRVIARDEEFVIWCYSVGRFNQRWKYLLTREGCYPADAASVLIRPTSLKRVREWLFEHRIHGHEGEPPVG